jgi:transposase-like protein
MATDLRWERGTEIAHKGSQIRKLGFGTYEVRSQKTQKWQYVVSKADPSGWTCSCPDYVLDHNICKHIYSVIEFFVLRRKAAPSRPSPEGKTTTNELSCPSCNSPDVVKSGIRKTKLGSTQRFVCKTCRHRFIRPSAFLKVKSDPQVITASLDLYFKGCSLHAIQDHIGQFYGVKVSHVAVLKWIRKYTALMRAYSDQFVPKANGIWHVDEMMVKVKRTKPMLVGNPPKKERYAWLWNLMDRNSRFLLASQIHKTRSIKNARRVFAAGKAITGTTPAAVVHDGLVAYDDAFVKEFYSNTEPRVTNVRSVGATKQGINQLVERLNGTVRHREKVMRGMHHDESAQVLLDGHRVYYNFLRPHISLDGKTPAEAAGIDLGLDRNRWSELIAQAHASQRKRRGAPASNG